MACGSSGAERSAPTTVPARPLTSDQAAQLASTLYRNYQAGGAHIDAQVPYSATESVGLSGDVDFAAHSGHVTVLTAMVGSGPITENVDFTAGAVYQAERAAGPAGGVGWTSRPPDPTNRPLDRIIQLIVALASPQRDNPLLIAQGKARFTGHRPFAGTTVNLYRFNASITYWVGATDGLLYRFVGMVQGIGGPVTIDLSQRGPHPTPPPSAAEIIPG